MKKLSFTILLILFPLLSAFAQKLTAEETYTKGIDAVVAPERRAKLKNVTAVGDAVYRQGTNHQRSIPGKSVFVSEADRVAVAMTFQLDNYRTDRLTFDGRKVAIPFIQPGIRSVLGEYLTKNEEIVKEGLFGGALSTVWLLGEQDSRLKRLSNSGKKKIDGKELLVLSYSTRSGTGLNVRLFFDASTFLHLRTEYKRTISAQMGPTPETSARQSETIEEMWEEFSDHVTENGVTLPRSYKIRIANVRGGNTREFFYEFKFNTFYYDQDLDAQTFSTDIK